MLIAFSGLKGAGKDTAAQVLIDEYGFTRIAFADAVRDAALKINPWIPMTDEPNLWAPLAEQVKDYGGWDYIKRQNSEVRRLLQVIGTEFGRSLDEDIWIQALYNKFPDIGSPDSNYVITDCRFDNEVRFIHLKGGYVCWIDRPGLVSDGHASENTGIKDKADYIINNDDVLSELQEDVRFMMVLRGVDDIKSRTSNQS